MRRKFLFEYDMTFITIMSVVLFIIPCIIVYGYYLLTRNMPLNVVDQYFVNGIKSENLYQMVFVYFLFMVLMFLWMVLHEIIHGKFYVLKGANKKNITYGAALEKGVFYCRCGEFIYKENVMMSLMAPFTIIGVITLVIGMIIHSYLLIFLSVVNISGAAGDIVMFFFFLDKKEDKNLRFIEFGDTLTFCLESFEDLSKTHNKGVKFSREIYNDSELPVNDNSKKIQVSKGSYIVLIFIVVLFSVLFGLSLSVK